MNKTTLKKLVLFIQEEEKKYELNDYLMNYIAEDELLEVEDSDELRTLFDKANENYEITDTEVIYYANAIEYLKENDQSLMQSMEIASEYGYETSAINSELLASLLKSRNHQEDYATLIDAIINKYENLV